MKQQSEDNQITQPISMESIESVKPLEGFINVTMDFSSALLVLKDGKKIRRKSWAPHYYCYIDPRYPKMIMYLCGQPGFTDDDLLADDWEVRE